MDLDIGRFYKHEDSGCVYTIVLFGRMKCADGGWVEAVTYKKPGNPDNFTRSVHSFKKSFAPCSTKIAVENGSRVIC